MANSVSKGIDPAARPGKRERLVTAACDLVHHQGIARTTLADIAQAADVPLGNVYYYFKTKDAIIAAVVQARAHQIETALAALERQHRSPTARLKGLVRALAKQAESIAQYGCPHGTLCLELAKHDPGSERIAAPLMQIPVSWAEQQFRAMGRRDARDLAIGLVTSHQGNAVLTSALGRPEFMSRQARRLERWIDALRV
jgi:AcrR family transcriptional regulator